MPETLLDIKRRKCGTGVCTCDNGCPLVQYATEQGTKLNYHVRERYRDSTMRVLKLRQLMPIDQDFFILEDSDVEISGQQIQEKGEKYCHISITGTGKIPKTMVSDLEKYLNNRNT